MSVYNFATPTRKSQSFRLEYSPLSVAFLSLSPSSTRALKKSNSVG